MEFNDILFVLLTAVLPLLVGYVCKLVSVQVGGTKYAGAVNAVVSAVQYVNQTFVDALKETGDFDNDAKMYALRKAKDAALEIMERGARKWLEKSVDNVDEWLEVQIEKAVKEAKSNGKGVS